MLVKACVRRIFLRHSPHAGCSVHRTMMRTKLGHIHPTTVAATAALVTLLPMLASAKGKTSVVMPVTVPAFKKVLVRSVAVFIIPMLRY